METLPRGPERLVMCPRCKRTFRTAVNLQWYYKRVKVEMGYPQMHCLDCAKHIDDAAHGEGDEGEMPNGERAPR